MKKSIYSKLLALLLFCFMQLAVFAQNRDISGKVSDADGVPLPGVSIQIKGTTLGSITDFDGNYTITVPENATLIFSFIGYTTQEIPVADQTEIVITLREDIMELDEIVVVGYGTSKKSDLTGAMTSLNQEDFNAIPGATPEQMMQGRVAGVEITSNNGEPGAGASITVRGASTFRSGAQPLYVIDGIPMDMQNTSPDGPSKGGIGSTATNPLNFLNPNDIESIDILKDASAAAIYGSRGANGVIIITTKKGKEGKSEVDYSTSFSISELPRKLDVLTADEWRVIRVDTLGLEEYDYGANTDWQDQIFRTSIGQTHNLSLSNGTKNTSYRVSFGYLNQEGIIKNSDREKYSGRLNLNQKGLNNRLLVETNLTMTHETSNRPPVGAAGYEGDLLLNALKANPTWPLEDEEGNVFQTGGGERVPAAMLAYHRDKTRTVTLLGGLAATLNIIEGLNYKINLGTNYSNANRFINISQKLNYAAGTYGVGEINNKELWNYVIEHTLNYSKAFGTQKLDFLAGYSYQDFNLRGNKTLGGGYATDGILYTNRIQAGQSSYSEISSWADTYQMQSFFGRVNYNLAEKYLATFTLRADGSSKFGSNTKYGYFPSAAIAWRISQEEFMKNIDAISNLKLRFGWGQTGNSEVGTKNSRYLYTIDDGSKAIIGRKQIAGFKISRTPNPDIAWETTTSSNIGIDFGIFKGRVSGTMDWFRKTTTDLLHQIPAPPGSPTATVVRNIDSCSIVNTGLEIGLSLYPLTKGEFTWQVNVNATYITNIVNDLPVDQYPTGRAAGQGLTDAYVQVITSDQPMNVFYGLHVDSISPDGDVHYLQTKPDERGRTTDSLTFLGNPQPKFTWSLTNSFGYKNFDFSFFIEGKHGHKIFNNTALLLEKTNVELAQNALTDFVYDEINYDIATEVSDRYLENGSYVRLANATIGYTLTLKNIEWMSRFRIYVSGSNLLLFTNYSGFDPDVNSNQSKDDVRSLGVDISSYPKSRSYIAGINVTF